MNLPTKDDGEHLGCLLLLLLGDLPLAHGLQRSLSLAVPQGHDRSRFRQDLLSRVPVLLGFLPVLGRRRRRGGGAHVGPVGHQHLMAGGRSLSQGALGLRPLPLATAAVVELIQLQIFSFIDSVLNEYLMQAAVGGRTLIQTVNFHLCHFSAGGI